MAVRVVSRSRRFLHALLATFLTSLAASADESDQFMVWGIELKDSAPVINGFINNRVSAILELVNRDNPDCDCETLTTGILTDIYQDRIRADLPRFIEASDEFDVFPRRDVANGEIIDASVYRYAITGLTIRVTRNLRIGDVYLSTDKLNHFFGIGRRYYTRYLGFRREGQSHDEAEKNAILWGLLTENTFLGTTTNGIFSVADLEANYQGFKFALNLCASESPYLVHRDGRWSQVRPVDIAAHVSPYFDETFDPPLYSELIREAVYVVLERDYAQKAKLEAVARRFQRYRELAPAPSRSMYLVAQYLHEHQVPSQRQGFLAALGLKETDPTAPWDPYSLGVEPADRP